MLNKLFNPIFGGDADEVHLFGASFKERIEEGLEIIAEGIEDISKAASSFGEEDSETAENLEDVTEEVEIIEP